MSCLCPADDQLILTVQAAFSDVSGSSPGGPTTSHKNHRVMSLGSRDRNPLVWGIGAGVGNRFVDLDT